MLNAARSAAFVIVAVALWFPWAALTSGGRSPSFSSRVSAVYCRAAGIPASNLSMLQPDGGRGCKQWFAVRRVRGHGTVYGFISWRQWWP
ncbi:hypothetical protein TNCT_557011 [Trichonephila clavata]|uniref:Uncharacterized protein n=1 Tax=Trichonephila clavata TaxID=2740835 RepID=A0A8X6HLB3_TRICU|nr:hypothetical protein TNCT_557011 [Trichonephila clavata]